jgi:hypothetical protein
MSAANDKVDRVAIAVFPPHRRDQRRRQTLHHGGNRQAIDNDWKVLAGPRPDPPKFVIGRSQIKR